DDPDRIALLAEFVERQRHLVERGRAGIGAMGIAEEDEMPLALELRVAERLAVLVDEMERAANRAGEKGPGRTFRVVAVGEADEPAGGEDEKPRQGHRNHRKTRCASRFLGGRGHGSCALNGASASAYCRRSLSPAPLPRPSRR